jgi:alkylation response protein AidB-like acyl-CoA dehydrogenase
MPGPIWRILQTMAEDKGDHYLVNGQKTWTSGGQWADKCFCARAHRPQR